MKQKGFFLDEKQKWKNEPFLTSVSLKVTSVYFHIFHIYCYCGPEFKHMQAHKLQWKLSKT